MAEARQMDPTAFILLLAALYSPTAGSDAGVVASVMLSQARLVPAYVTIEGLNRTNVTYVYLIRQGKATKIRLKQLRGHPELDPKLEPGDIVRIPETFF